jgi:LuxR family maltose regulon positive regulatory protein
MAWMCEIDGRPLRAREHLESALAIAHVEGLVHPFLRAGERVIDLVDEMFSAHDDFARRIARVARAATTRSHTSLVQELTARELELLAYLPTRLTIGDIAERCYVSTNTVKTHLGHIYRKLGVPGRNAAIERAVELNLLQRRDAEIVPT